MRLQVLFNWFLLQLILLSTFGQSCSAQGLLPGYNSVMYPDVLSAAVGLAKPFLYQQEYLFMPGLTINDTEMVYNTDMYGVYDNYINPAPGYYISASDYGAYGINGFQSIWPIQIPNVMYDSSVSLFNATVDCVGYGTRLLSATGDTSVSGNAYLNLIHTIRTQNFSPFAHQGYVATAYQFAVAFPTLPTQVSSGWQYVCGNAEDSLINAYNQTIQSGLSNYTGVRLGGFAQAKAGDVMAFGYSAASSSNGHFAVLEKQPQRLNKDSLDSYLPAQNGPDLLLLLARFNVYATPVFDCSGLMAHFRDSRTQMSGIGHGTLIMLTDPTDDAPWGYIFDTLQTEGTLTYDSIGTHVYAISVGRFVTTGAGVQPVERPLAVQVYPNPMHEHEEARIVLSNPRGSLATIRIFDVSGRVVDCQDFDDRNMVIRQNTLAPGMYWVELKEANQSFGVVKVVIQ